MLDKFNQTVDNGSRLEGCSIETVKKKKKKGRFGPNSQRRKEKYETLLCKKM